MPVLNLQLTSRDDAGRRLVGRTEVAYTAVAAIVCDMWDHHWCAAAERRVGEMAPAMNRLLHRLRDAGSFIIHAPSETMAFYEGHPARRRAKDAPVVDTPVQFTRRPLDKEAEAPLPIDDSDGGCDDAEICLIPEKWPWTRQIAAIDISDQDAVTDSGSEVHNLLDQHCADLVLMMGVHTNMCILARPFGIRRLVQAGRKVALVRDMTDAMYNPRKAPFVDHFRGTELVIEHIERYWCPSITSDQVTGEEAFSFQRH